MLHDSQIVAIAEPYIKPMGAHWSCERGIQADNVEEFARDIEETVLEGYQVEQLRAFAIAVMRSWPEGDVDGGDLQGFAVKCGLLTPQTMFAPCGDNCLCADTFGEGEFEYGVDCYRKVDWLIGGEDK